jgi:hypothetical protein
MKDQGGSLCQEFHLIKVATSCTSGVINGFAMKMLEWLKRHNMADMRRQTEYMNQLILAKLKDFAAYMTAIAIA